MISRFCIYYVINSILNKILFKFNKFIEDIEAVDYNLFVEDIEAVDYN